MFGLDTEILNQGSDTEATDIHDDAEREDSADDFFGRDGLGSRLKNPINFFGRNVGVVEVETDQTHATGRVTVIHLRENKFFRSDGGAGGVLAARFTMDISHGSDVMKDATVTGDTLELFHRILTGHELVTHVKNNRDRHLGCLKLLFVVRNFLNVLFVHIFCNNQ